MGKTIIIYSLAMAAGAFALQWLEYQYAVRVFTTEIYVLIIATCFTALGIWLGHRLTRRPAKTGFEKNTRAIDALRISPREYQVLELLAKGHTNDQIASDLFVSTNTVKTHLSSLYRKLEVSRRTQAIQRARQLKVIA